MNRPIYLDHHATTPLDPRVLDAMLPYFGPRFGNPASRTHVYGWESARAVESARQRVAALIGADASEISFVSSATESVNLALHGVCSDVNAAQLVVASSEHRAVLDVAASLEVLGLRVTRLAVDSQGSVDSAELERALAPSTRLVSLMAANNEVGTIHPLPRLASIAASHGVLFHSDASQAVGRIPTDVRNLGVDLMSFSAHKLYGPKGAGALFIRRGVEPGLLPRIRAGGHARGLRSGTLNVPAIVGFGAAAEIAIRELDAEAARLQGLRERLLQALRAALDGVFVHGHPVHRLPGNLSVSFAGVDGEALLTAVPEVAASTGSACESDSVEASHVLLALGLKQERIRGTVRFGVGRFNTEAEIDRAAGRLIEEVRRLRSCSQPQSVAAGARR